MTQPRREEIADSVDRTMRQGEAWWLRILRDGKIPIPTAIMIFLATWALWSKMDTLQRTISNSWTVDMQDKFAADAQEQNGWNEATHSWNWKHPDVHEVQEAIRKRGN